MSESFKKIVLVISLVADLLTIVGYFFVTPKESNLSTSSGWDRVSDFALSPIGLLAGLFTYIFLVMCIKIYGDDIGIDFDFGMEYVGPAIIIATVYFVGFLFMMLSGQFDN